jgi:pyrroloquinoline quinone (PQQ) biosynthesis protein C
MRLPRPRGPLAERVLGVLHGEQDPGGLRDLPLPPASSSVLDDADFQLTLWVLYELHYRGFDEIDDHEWDPDVIAARGQLEVRFEAELRRRTADEVRRVLEVDEDLMHRIQRLVSTIEGPNVAGFLQREATVDQVRGFLARRSLYHLKESDPHSFVLARIDGRAKTALAELQYDEYGAGRPERLHARLYAEALRASGLDDGYGAYVEQTPATTLAVNNLMSLFGLHRRLRGAALGHLAAFESTSSLPCRRIAAGIERVGLPEATAAYFHEHVEADAVHEQVAVRDVCGGLLESDPGLLPDVLFGVAACLLLDVVDGADLMGEWTDEPSALEERTAS